MNTEFIAHYLEPNKEPQSVQKHLEEAADAARVFAGKVGLSSIGELSGLLHDFGKYSKAFQDRIATAEGKLNPDEEVVDSSDPKGRKPDHSTAGAQMAWETLKDRDPMSMFLAQVIALCVASHHSGLMDCLTPDGEDKFSMRMAKESMKSHQDEARRKADGEIVDRIAPLIDSSQCLNDLKQQLERLLQGEDSREVREFHVGLLVRFVFSALIDADRLSAAGRTYKNNDPQWNLLIERMEKYVSGIEQQTWIDEIRSEVSNACRGFASRDKGLYQLTVPTGGAKTLSSLRFGLHHTAHHEMDRIIYVVPYTTIIDQNAAVVRGVLEDTIHTNNYPVVLEHHSNLTPEKETWQSKLLAENWDATVIFTTTVQFLEALFAGGTRGARRMHQLANAVIIFDEIQTLPIQTVHLFNNAVNFLVKGCGSTVVFCTATQPLLHDVDTSKGAARLADKPEMAPRPNELFSDLHRVDVLDERKNGGWEEIEIAELICNEAKETGSALAIVNTKAAARSLYNLCKEQIDSVFHLSTNMCPAHRIKILDDIKEKINPENPNPEPTICISTQLIEAGVDIDFASVVRYLAGLDSIAQAAGRCNRNGRRPPGKIFIVNPSHESLDKLPEIREGRKTTERILEEYRRNPDDFDCDVLSPKAMAQYYKYYFFNRAHEMSYRVSARDIGHDDDLLNMLSVNTQAVQSYHRANKCAPNMPLWQSFKSAASTFKVIDAPTEGIIVPYCDAGKEIIAKLCAVSDLKEAKFFLRKAQRFSVNLFPQALKELQNKNALNETHKGSGILYLDEQYYTDELGVVLEPIGHMPFCNA